jgi:putative hydrolase of the HAD superfamily
MTCAITTAATTVIAAETQSLLRSHHDAAMRRSPGMARQANAGGPVEAVLLDAMGTMVRLEPPGPRLRAELIERAGVDVGEERAAAAFRAEIDFYVDHHLEGRDHAGLERLRDRCAAVVAEALAKPRLDVRVVREAMLAALRFRADPDAAGVLRELRDDGLRLVAVSNWDCSLPDVLAGVGVAPQLDGVVASATVGAAKPDPAIFRAGLDRVGAPPERAVHVGDSLDHDVVGARAAGLRAVLLTREEETEIETPPGVQAIRSLRDLPSVI